MEENEKSLLWNSSFSVGVQEIDEQHKKLVEILNELVYLVGKELKDEKQNIDVTVKKIIEYKTIHFATEEKYFKQFDFDGAEEHIQKHREFSQKTGELLADFGSTGEKIHLVELLDFMEIWFVDHMLNMDSKYKECFKQHGLK